MMTRYRVLPYKQGSKGAKALATALGGKVLRIEGSSFVPDPEDVIINWGNTSHELGLPPCRTFNLHGLKTASNKLAFFNIVKAAGREEIIPRFWTNKGDIPNDAYPIVCRTVLSGHSGAGIVISGGANDLADAQLYVQYLKKKDEYRVHCAKDDAGGTTIICVQRKARRSDCQNVNWQIRNHSNGFVFVRNNVNPPPYVIAVAREALELSGLDFGAVDVIWNAQQEKAYVLEVNTAPGLEGQTITDYATFFRGPDA